MAHCADRRDGFRVDAAVAVDGDGVDGFQHAELKARLQEAQVDTGRGRGDEGLVVQIFRRPKPALWRRGEAKGEA
jgi:hypothetical protein